MYKEFSKVYDYFMENVPYDEWYENFNIIFKKYSINPTNILDLGCGTGTLTTMLAMDNICVTGIDISKEMIEEGKKKNRKYGLNVNYLEKNMIDFKFNDKFQIIISSCDSYNYILKDEDLLKSFISVKNHLNSDGVFIFDINTEYYYKNTLGNTSYSDVAEDSSFIINNSYDEKTKINSYELHLFIQKENGDYKKIEEYHKVRGREVKIIKDILKNAGLNCIDILDTVTMERNKKDSNRIYFICKL